MAPGIRLLLPEFARETLTGLTRPCPLRLALDTVATRGFLHHGHIFLGDTPLRGHKYKGRWWFDEAEIHSAGQALADLRVDPENLVGVDLLSCRPARRDPGQAQEWGPGTDDWPQEISGWIHNAAFKEWFDRAGAAGDDDGRDLDVIGPEGLPGRLTLAALRERCANSTCAGTYPLDLMVWSGSTWRMPRAYAELLDRWRRRNTELLERARICSGCNKQGPLHGPWRTPTARGYVTLCPECSGAAYVPYDGTLRGVPYGKVPRASRADGFLCRLCTSSRAFTWDHCHDHGLVRGPLCASCNTWEGKGLRFLERQGAPAHLLECTGCRTDRTLPERFRLDVAADHVRTTERHGRCRSRPWLLDVTVRGDGADFALGCRAHGTRWNHRLRAAEITDLVAAFVTAVAAADDC